MNSKPAKAPVVFVGAYRWEVSGDKIGGGGQGSVFPVKLLNGDLKGEYLVKVFIPKNQANKRRPIAIQRERFEREVEALSRLKEVGCPNIVEVIDWKRGGEETVPWMIMKRVGIGAMRSDNSFVENYQGNVKRVLEVVRDIALALVTMHTSAPTFVHRDIKCENVLLAGQGGKAVLGDFGLVHFDADADEDRHKTDVGDRVGPRLWRPPELKAIGERRDDPASDIYLLGGLLYEGLTGQSLDETINGDGQFVHEQPEFSIKRFTNDPRADGIEYLLRQMFRRRTIDRPKAATVLKRVNELLAWKPDEPVPQIMSREDEEREVIQAFLRDSPIVKNAAIQGELRPLCERVANRFGNVGETGEIQKQVSVNVADGCLRTLIAEYPQAGWVATRVLCRFDTGHVGKSSMHMAYVAYGRLTPDEEALVFIDERENHDWLYRGTPGSEEFERLMAERTQHELDRLTRLVIDDIKRNLT